MGLLAVANKNTFFGENFRSIFIQSFNFWSKFQSLVGFVNCLSKEPQKLCKVQKIKRCSSAPTVFLHAIAGIMSKKKCWKSCKRPFSAWKTGQIRKFSVDIAPNKPTGKLTITEAPFYQDQRMEQRFPLFREIWCKNCSNILWSLVCRMRGMQINCFDAVF